MRSCKELVTVTHRHQVTCTKRVYSVVKNLRQRSDFAHAQRAAWSLTQGHTRTVLPDNSILITANMLSETGFPSSHQLKSYVVSSCLKLAARAVLSADAGLLVALRHLVL